MAIRNALKNGLVGLCLAMPIGCAGKVAQEPPKQPEEVLVKGVVNGHYVTGDRWGYSLSFVLNLTIGEGGNFNTLCSANDIGNNRGWQYSLIKYSEVGALLRSAQNQKKEVLVKGILESSNQVTPRIHVKSLNVLNHKYRFE